MISNRIYFLWSAGRFRSTERAPSTSAAEPSGWSAWTISGPSPKKILGVLTRRIYLRPYFDAAFLPGERQRSFARKLGFRRNSVFEGFYSCDTTLFSTAAGVSDTRSRSFLYSGRLVEDEGLLDLAEAYASYREQVSDPWPLVIAGAGPLDGHLSALAGVEIRGFLQPDALASLMRQSSFLVLPSHYEPWGVVVHEAAATGLGVIASSAVGAADLFVRHGGNGWIAAARRFALGTALLWAHQTTPEKAAQIQDESELLALQRQPSDWLRAIREMAALGRSVLRRTN